MYHVGAAVIEGDTARSRRRAGAPVRRHAPNDQIYPFLDREKRPGGAPVVVTRPRKHERSPWEKDKLCVPLAANSNQAFGLPPALPSSTFFEARPSSTEFTRAAKFNEQNVSSAL